MTEVSFDEITQALKSQGIAAYTEQTGGGCATIMVGEVRSVTRPSVIWVPASGAEGPDTAAIISDGKVRVDNGTVTEDRYAVLVGPGWFNGYGWSDPYGDTADLYVGPDDDGESGAHLVPETATVADIVAEVVRQYRESEGKGSGPLQGRNVADPFDMPTERS